MDIVEYERMDAAEDQLWWYQALHHYLLDAFASAALPPAGPVLDAGCGTGGLLRALATICPDRARFGLERFDQAANRARAKSAATIVQGTVNALPFDANRFAAVFSADVLYHRAVDPKAALAEASRCLLPGGALFVNVPAFQWLSSYHDQRVHGALRFSRSQLTGLLNDAGFARVQVRYWNSLLFPVMVARRLRPARPDAPSDVAQLPAFTNSALRAVVAFERSLVRLGIRFPAGGSLIAIAFKP